MTFRTRKATTMNEHQYHDREDGLLHCKICNGGEGSLPSECPGRRMTEEEDNDVYAGTLDYRQGQWVRRAARCPFCGQWTYVDSIERPADYCHHDVLAPPPALTQEGPGAAIAEGDECARPAEGTA
jgi:hypothetical protein